MQTTYGLVGTGGDGKNGRRWLEREAMVGTGGVAWSRDSEHVFETSDHSLHIKTEFLR